MGKEKRAMSEGADYALAVPTCAASASLITASPPDWERRWRELITGKARGPGAGAARAGLWALAGVYRGGIGAYRLAYELGILRTVTASCRIISVGNLTV